MRKFLSPLLILGLLALCLAPEARAEGPDDQTRYHDAYALEIVEGKVAEAARVYLALMNDPKVAPRLRAESRFRFAICAVLLGRADEGRVQLERLVADTTAPAAIRDRAQAYMSTVAGIGVGTELDKKLQALVFDLGRVSPKTSQVAVYRDFEIIGVSAIPFVRRLLQHTDRNLRQHAFRLLARLKDPGLASRWSPDLWSHGAREFITYLVKNPAELAAFEERVIQLGTPAFQVVRYMPVTTSKRLFSLAFLRAFAKSKLAPGTAAALLGYSLDDSGFDQLVAWMDDEDVALADKATDWLMQRAVGHKRADAAFFRKVLGRLMDRLADEKVHITSKGLDRFSALSQVVPVKDILDAFEAVLEDIETHGGLLQADRASTELVNPIAQAVYSRVLTEQEAERHTALLLRWLAIGEASTQALREAGKSGTYLPVEDFVPHLGHALTALSEKRAMTVVRRIVSKAPRFNNRVWARLFMPTTDTRGIHMLAAAIEATPPGALRGVLFQILNAHPKKPFSAAFRQASDNARHDLLDHVSASETSQLLAKYSRVMGQRASTEVQREVLRLLARGRSLEPEKRDALRLALLRGGREYFTKVLAPLAQENWNGMNKEERRTLLRGAVQYTQRTALNTDALRDAAAALLRAHLDETDPNHIFDLRHDRKRFPLATWIPFVPKDRSSWLARLLQNVGPEEADDAARKMTAPGQPVTQPVLQFITRFASPAVKTSVLDAQLTSNDPARRALALGLLTTGGVPASTKALEKLVALELAADPLDMGRLRSAGNFLLARHPSETLFPVARAMLASKERHDILAGIRMADSLGREDLVPALAKHLGSMDAQVRVQAKKAVAAIRAVAAVQAEEILRKHGR